MPFKGVPIRVPYEYKIYTKEIGLINDAYLKLRLEPRPMIKLLKIKNYKSSFLHDKIETSIELLEWFDVDDVDDKDYCDDCRDI